MPPAVPANAPGVRDTGRLPAATAAEHRVVMLLGLVLALAVPAAGRPQAPAAASADDHDTVEPSVFLPGDRGRERQLDRARRLTADERWSDAAMALDELLALERDAFTTAGNGTTRGSIRATAAAVVASLPRPGRDAYHRLFDGRAAQQLATAIGADDQAAIIAVARRWLHTPAGRQAALLAAMTMLESGQPVAASAWLERLAPLAESADLEPSLTALRAIARYQAGDEQTAVRLLAAAGRGGRSSLRLAGRELPLPTGPEAALAWLATQAGTAGRTPRPGGDWRQFGGGPTRTGLTAAARPLLVPRYRVPLVRHPEEARRLEQARRAAADAGMPFAPAATPLAVGDRIVVSTPLGILAIEFESGRRIWLESAVQAAEIEPAVGAAGWPADERSADPTVQRAFGDATSGTLASDGRLVFAVETPTQATAPGRGPFARFGGVPGDAAPGNTLSAYALADGGVVWRLPAAAAAGRGGGAVPDAAIRWQMGPPLVVGAELFLLVEERGEVVVEVRAAANGSLLWSQPLASFDEADTVASRDARGRRQAGLTPALDEGVLVCLIGAGCVVAVDVATRSLLWAHAYPRAAAEAGGRHDMLEPPADADELTGRRGGEPAPIIAGGRVVLAAFDSELLICLGLRDGKPAWRRPRDAGTRIAGATDGRLLTVGDTAAEAIDLATGRPVWNRGLGEGVRPSGRSLLSAESLLVPCDDATVVEIAVADGRILGRSQARGGRIPGNLVAHRGEVISRGVDSLDVFHQEEVLEERIETARRAAPEAPWIAFWEGQAALESGDVAGGLASLARAAAAPGFRIPPGVLDEAVVAAMGRDFATAARLWADFPARAETQAAPAVARMAVDGFLAAGDAASAWQSLESLLTAGGDPTSEAGAFPDPGDPAVVITSDRWIQGRLARVAAAADPPLRERIDAACVALVAAALAGTEPPARPRRLEILRERLGARLAAGGLTGPLAEVTADRPAPRGEAGGWPLGQVEVRESRRRQEQAAVPRPQLLPVPLLDGGAAGTTAVQAALDLARERLVISDAFGRPVTDPLPVAGLDHGVGMPFFNQVMPLELAVLGRRLFVRSAAGIAAYDLEAAPGSGRGLWRRPEFSTGAGDRVRWGGGATGRVARDGAVPLGLRIMEPADRPRGSGRGMMLALPTGLVVPGTRSVVVLDPATGRVLWERRRLPPGLEWFADAEFLCGTTHDGRESVVCQMSDGRLLHKADVPHGRHRLAVQGYRFVAVGFLDEQAGGGIAPRVRLDLVDPVDRETRPLGEFTGDARATATADGRLAVLEPAGRLSLFDLTDGSLVFETRLAEMPDRMERLQLQPWEDRYLVLAGASDGEPAADVAPLEQFLLAGGAAAPLTAAVWAVDRVTGRPLWPVPAIVERHCLHPAQPPGLPILTFCRLLQRRGGGQPSLSVLCLDKRTGHAVYERDRVPPQAPVAFGCDLAGDPRRATIALGDARPVELVFTGRPLAPQPPFRGRGRYPPATDGGLPEIRE